MVATPPRVDRDEGSGSGGKQPLHVAIHETRVVVETLGTERWAERWWWALNPSSMLRFEQRGLGVFVSKRK